ncbi:MAG: PilZ domain-containing protein [Deltaproteobacteria bacterium]|jgi:Tfp pilus assembly protein PilZ|nr:PilZ domain-containing protein [Deltaproteobacteria bacterium]MDX2496952.1 PilZ domain-containing protein [Desulfobacterales bacterium]MBW1748125.1 PilZ domain-containing protein [Deltaproteobacteria bacterium]MBW1826095.1 PilZ domain-containing protein [Deltaproteobacteria bacterium]MBW1968033.1 PilZ domain-containing protein [Deltaproteobacteria bacterium]
MGNKDIELGKNEVRAFLFEIIDRMSESEMRQLLNELEERQNRERRSCRRKDFPTMVDYNVADRYYRDFIQNISERGVFIKTTETFSEGQETLMTFMSPDYQKPFKIKGEIVRLHPDGVGVKFKIESAALGTGLKSLIKMIQSD